MSRGYRRTAVGVGLALALALSAVSPVQAAVPTARGTRADRTVRTESLLGGLWSHLVAAVIGDPRGPQLTQGPTVDPNGVH